MVYGKSECMGICSCEWHRQNFIEGVWQLTKVVAEPVITKVTQGVWESFLDVSLSFKFDWEKNLHQSFYYFTEGTKQLVYKNGNIAELGLKLVLFPWGIRGSWILSQWCWFLSRSFRAINKKITQAGFRTHGNSKGNVSTFPFSEVLKCFNTLHLKYIWFSLLLLFLLFIPKQYFLRQKEKESEEGFAQIGACLVLMSVSKLV